ncbi:hypothetical protein O1M63_49420 [Streptomyces mirabilis]|nr:hypothetical protein [Streptomyces mirabilis]
MPFDDPGAVVERHAGEDGVPVLAEEPGEAPHRPGGRWSRLHQDRKTFWGFLRTGVLIGLLAGPMPNFLVAYVNAGLHGYYVDLTEEAVRGCGFGFWSGLVLGLVRRAAPNDEVGGT